MPRSRSRIDGPAAIWWMYPSSSAPGCAGSVRADEMGRDRVGDTRQRPSTATARGRATAVASARRLDARGVVGVRCGRSLSATSRAAGRPAGEVAGSCGGRARPGWPAARPATAAGPPPRTPILRNVGQRRSASATPRLKDERYTTQRPGRRCCGKLGSALFCSPSRACTMLRRRWR